jgi:hypothetical protein
LAFFSRKKEESRRTRKEINQNLRILPFKIREYPALPLWGTAALMDILGSLPTGVKKFLTALGSGGAG